MGIVCLGAALLFCAYLLPMGKIRRHAQESGEVLRMEGTYWRMLPYSPHTNLDNHTDSLMLLTAAYDNPKIGLAEKAMYNYYNVINGLSLPESCAILTLEEEGGYTTHAYPRYWHGYLVVLKPLLLFLNLGEIRQLNWLVVMGSVLLTGILLEHRKKRRYLFPYLLFVCFLTPGTIASSLQNSAVYHMASAAGILFLAFYSKKRWQEHLWLFFMAVGMAASYFDLLTYPVVTLGLPLAFWLILAGEENISEGTKCADIFGHMLLYPLLWALGYAGMWFAKWQLASWITGENVIPDAVNSIRVRTGNVAFEREITGWDVYTKLSLYLESNRIWTAALVFAGVCFLLLWLSKTRWKAWPVSASFLLLAGYPLLWGLFAKNHTYIHDLFSHRNWGLTVLGISCCLIPMIGREWRFPGLSSAGKGWKKAAKREIKQESKQ